MVVIRSIHQYLFSNRAALHLRSNSLKNVCKWIDATLFFFLKKNAFMRYFLKAFEHTCGIAILQYSFLQNNYFSRAPLKSCFCALKIWVDSFGNIWNNKKSSTLLIIKCAKNELHCWIENFPKSVWNLSGTIISKNIFGQLFLLLLQPLWNFKCLICVVW